MVSGLVSYTPLLFNGSKMSLSPGLIVNAILEILLFCSVILRKENSMNIIRQPTKQGEKLTYKFPVKGSKFLVKNFTDGDIEVTFDSGDKTGILIPENAAQICIIGESSGWGLYVRDTLYITAKVESEKGVEVQCLRW